MGLSPLTRGNRVHSLTARRARGPIPAHAGQPRRACGRQCARRAYPRSRGATCQRSSRIRSRVGLSPLTRGNPIVVALGARDAGPIPAHAGQPAATSTPASGSRAYPRSRGATRRCRCRCALAAGLSPLTRGNRRSAAPADRGHGPIPAHAGQPRTARPASRKKWAYPRSRGATDSPSQVPISPKGLSPLTRGNRLQRRAHAARCGPIPAHAGQPCSGLR